MVLGVLRLHISTRIYITAEALYTLLEEYFNAYLSILLQFSDVQGNLYIHKILIMTDGYLGGHTHTWK
jgi:hypothetical protein